MGGSGLWPKVGGGGVQSVRACWLGWGWEVPELRYERKVREIQEKWRLEGRWSRDGAGTEDRLRVTGRTVQLRLAT